MRPSECRYPAGDVPRNERIKKCQTRQNQPKQKAFRMPSRSFSCFLFFFFFLINKNMLSDPGLLKIFVLCCVSSIPSPDLKEVSQQNGMRHVHFQTYTWRAQTPNEMLRLRPLHQPTWVAISRTVSEAQPRDMQSQGTNRGIWITSALFLTIPAEVSVIQGGSR